MDSILQQLREVKEEQARQKEREKIRKIPRRSSYGIVAQSTPLQSSPPRISYLTDPTYARLHTPSSSTRPAGRLSVGRQAVMVEDEEEEDEEDGVVAEEEQELRSAAVQRVTMVSEREEKAKLAKVMSKISPPSKFSGATDADKEGVEQWVNKASNYLNGIFGGVEGEYPEQRLQFIMNLLEGPAAIWLNATHDANPTATWEELRGLFVEHVRGSRESRELWLQLWRTMQYGKGKCKTLLQLESVFDDLRVKLYPKSGADKDMNSMVAEHYGEVIRRGDVELWKEAMRLLPADHAPTLAEWKGAVGKADSILHRQSIGAGTGISTHHQGGGGGGGGQQWRQKQGGRPYSSSVNETNTSTAEEDDGERGEGQPPSASAQQLQGRRAPFTPRKSTRWLTEAEYRVVVDKQLCFHCYKPGHRIGDAACKDAAKPRRKPTAEELKA